MCWRDEGVDHWEKATRDMCSFLYKADSSSDSEQRAYMSQQQLIPKAGSLRSLASSSPLFMSEKRGLLARGYPHYNWKLQCVCLPGM